MNKQVPFPVPDSVSLAPESVLKLARCGCSAQPSCKGRCGCSSNGMSCTMFCSCGGDCSNRFNKTAVDNDNDVDINIDIDFDGE